MVHHEPQTHFVKSEGACCSENIGQSEALEPSGKTTARIPPLTWVKPFPFSRTNGSCNKSDDTDFLVNDNPASSKSEFDILIEYMYLNVRLLLNIFILQGMKTNVKMIYR